METKENRVTVGTRQNPITFYLRALLYMFMALLMRVVALLPLAAAFMWIPAGSPFRWLAVLTPLLFIFFVLPLRFSFAQALVQPARERRFSFDKATSVADYGAKLGEGLVHTLNILKWGIPLWLMLGACYYFYLKTDAISLMKGVEAIGAGVAGVLCAGANFFIGIFGGMMLVPNGGLMEGLYTVAAALGLGGLILLWGAMRNSAFRYIWALARQNGQRPRAEARRRLIGRRWQQLGVALINLILWVPAAYVVFTTLKGVLSNMSTTLFNYMATRQLNLPELSGALLPLVFAFLVCYMPLLPVRRILTAFFATKRLRRAVEAPPVVWDAETAAEEAPAQQQAFVPAYVAYAQPQTAPVADAAAEPPVAEPEALAAEDEPVATFTPYGSNAEPAPQYHAPMTWAQATAEPETAADEPAATPAYSYAAEPEPVLEPVAPATAPEAVEPESAESTPAAYSYAAEPELQPAASAEPEAVEPEPAEGVPAAYSEAAQPEAAPANPFAQEPAADEDDYIKPYAPATFDTTEAPGEDAPAAQPEESDTDK